MTLSDRDILRRLDEDLVIDPIENEETQIQPCSVDVRLAGKLAFPSPDVRELDVKDESTLKTNSFYISPAGYAIDPGEFLLGSTIERFEIPPDLKGDLRGRSSLGRLAITVHSTAGLLDPGFEGDVTLEITNEGPKPVRVYSGMRIGQVVFEQLSSPAERPYGSERGSKYQGQSGPTASRASEDFST